MKYYIFRIVLIVCSFVSYFVCLADWPTFRHDYYRSGLTREKIRAEYLELKWVYKSPRPPVPAWYGPARWDAWIEYKNIRPMRNYDVVFHTIVADGKLYFGSSSDDSVHCLDAETGKELWYFVTDGPVRIAPTFVAGRLYFGSDDGYAYCVDGNTGKFIWKYSPVVGNRQIINNNRYSSEFPVRTGVIVGDGKAYFGNSMLPWNKSYITAIDANTGEVIYKRELSKITMDGPFSSSSKFLISPQGRVSPILFDKTNGKYIGRLNSKKTGRGGAFVILTCNENSSCCAFYPTGTKKDWGIDQLLLQKREERIYEFPNGRSLVVSGDICYVIDDTTVFAYDRRKRKNLWMKRVDVPCEVILAGDFLFVGGRNKIFAYDKVGGKKIWESEVKGNAYGLSVSDGKLFVSTDVGFIYCFAPGSRKYQILSKKVGKKGSKYELRRKPTKVKEEGLLDCWVFDQDFMSDRNLYNRGARNIPARIWGKINFSQAGKYSVIECDGYSTTIRITDDISKIRLPVKTITVCSWVRIDEPADWGCIIGAFQDNGSYEKGWLLGYSGRRFCFAVAGKGGNGRLEYLKSPSEFEVGRWYYVVGTYDGRVVRLYINGREVAKATTQRGEIDYPPQAFYEIGAYHDKDEYFRIKGAIQEIRVYEKVLSLSEIKREFKNKIKGFPKKIKVITNFHTLAVGPYFQFTGYDEASIYWQTSKPSPTILEYFNTEQKKIIRKVDAAPKLEHKVVIDGLERNQLYKYHIIVDVDGKKRITKDFQIDTFFNYEPYPIDSIDSPFNGDKNYRKLAKTILSKINFRKGICVVIGVGEGQLAYELAKMSKFYVVGVDSEEDKIRSGRDKLIRAKVYGTRLYLRYVRDLSKLSFPECSANLVVADVSKLKANTVAFLKRILRPNGGVLITYGDSGIVDSTVRGKLKGTGSWVHMYGNIGNAGWNGETLSGAKRTDDFYTQWVGRPGPRFRQDRQGRESSPLAINGRLFEEGLNHIIAIDAYNGTILWTIEAEGVNRFNVLRDCCNWCADEDYIYLAVRNKCWKILAKDGQIEKFYNLNLKGVDRRYKYEWGYVGRYKNILFGSAVSEGAIYRQWWGKIGWYDWHEDSIRAKVCSDNLFAIDVDSGKTIWTYHNGVIINSSVVVGGDRIFFLASRNSKIIADKKRKIADIGLWKDLHLVALDVKTGKEIWVKRPDIVPGIEVIYMVYSDGYIVVCTSKARVGAKKGDKIKGYYNLTVYGSDKGDFIWQRNFPWRADHHGGHLNRPVVIDGMIYIRPHAFTLKEGNEIKTDNFWGACGTYSAYKYGLIFRRSGIITIWAVPDGKIVSGWHRLRPSCWLSCIPACGMLLAPEGGGGCSCGIWMETSVGFIPKNAE